MPFGFDYLWEIFKAVFDGDKVTYSELESYENLTKHKLNRNEVEAIMSFARGYITGINKTSG